MWVTFHIHQIRMTEAFTLDDEAFGRSAVQHIHCFLELALLIHLQVSFYIACIIGCTLNLERNTGHLIRGFLLEASKLHYGPSISWYQHEAVRRLSPSPQLFAANVGSPSCLTGVQSFLPFTPPCCLALFVVGSYVSSVLLCLTVGHGTELGKSQTRPKSKSSR